MNDEITANHLEEKESTIYTEDSYDAEEFIALYQVLEKWREVVRLVITRQYPYLGERAYNKNMGDKWGDFSMNFKIYTNQGDGTFSDQMKAQSRTMSSIYPIECNNISNFIIHGIQMDIRAVYNPLDSNKIAQKVMKGDIDRIRFSFAEEKRDFLNGKRKVEWVNRITRKTKKVTKEDIEEANAQWNKFWINPSKIHQICVNRRKFEEDEPAHTGVNSDWVSN